MARAIVDVTYDAETGKVVGHVTMNAETSFNDELKAEARAAKKAGTDRPAGGLVPYKYKFTVDNVLDDILPMAAADAKIREQRERGSYATPEAMEAALADKELERALVSDGTRQRVDSMQQLQKEAAAGTITKERAAELIAILSEIQ